jgi:hypothetical protein
MNLGVPHDIARGHTRASRLTDITRYGVVRAGVRRQAPRLERRPPELAVGARPVAHLARWGRNPKCRLTVPLGEASCSLPMTYGDGR